MNTKRGLTKFSIPIRQGFCLSFRVIEILIIVFLVGIIPYMLGKSTWDLIEILIIPAVLAVIAFLFNKAERNAENNIATDRQQEAALQAYLDYMTELLLERGIRTSKSASKPANDNIRNIARARTLTVLRQLDGKRKGLLVRFLYQLNLIKGGEQGIDLSGSDLSNAVLSGSDLGDNKDRTFMSYLSLYDVQLSGVDLTNANLSEAKLSNAFLVMADLTGANLSDAHLMYADMRSTTLANANFRNANLLGVNLSGAKGLTQKQLRQAYSVKGAILPDGTKGE